MGTHGRPRATVRRIGARDGQSGGGGAGPGQGGDDAASVSGGVAPQQGESGSDRRLGVAAAEMLNALHAAKEELAKELEANLKQLKTVLEETQRIQKQMEAVLGEARSESSLKDKAQGRQTGPHRQHQGAEEKGQGESAGEQQTQAGGGGQPAQGRSAQGQPTPWQPAAADQQQAPEAQGAAWGESLAGTGTSLVPPWQPPDLSAGVGTDQPPPWEPPVEATQQQNQRPTQH